MPDVIVIESPNKIKKIGAIVKGARILATVGHFKDLPADEMGVDLDTMEPKFIHSKGKKNVSDEIKKAAEGNKVYIATDPDREGYAIGTHVWEEIKRKASSVHRLEIREITEKGVKEAFAKSVLFSKTNQNLYGAFLGRRVGDRIVGYIVSPIACRALRGKYSVGRVQSPAVRLVVERDREIRKFVAEPYWVVHVLLEKNSVRFKAFHADGNIKNKARADAILARVLPATRATATGVEEKVTRQSPKPPFTTPDLQATAGAQLRFPTDRTMKLAQDLFENALITYHRTDSVRIADDFVAEIRDLIRSSYGPDFLPADPRRHKSKASQAEAHEAIRPTSMHPLSDCDRIVRGEGLSDDHVRLYDLVYKRAVASQMADALFDSTTLAFDVAGEPFKAKGRVVKFEGFLKLYSDAEEIKADKETAGGAAPSAPEDEEQRLPKVAKGEDVPKVGHDLEEKQTKPPGRYSEGTLVKTLERLGIGRPSTYASIVRTIKDREYVEIAKGKIQSTPKGEAIVDFLSRCYGWIVDYDMTRNMEEKLDEVEEKGTDWKTFARDLKERTVSLAAEEEIKGAGGGAAEGQPSEKQVKFAKTLSERHSIALPENLLSDRHGLSKWIDGVLKSAPKEEPGSRPTAPLSEKQMAVVERNATEDVKTKVKNGDIAAGRAFLDEFFGGFKKGAADKGKPSAKGKRGGGKPRKSRKTKVGSQTQIAAPRSTGSPASSGNPATPGSGKPWPASDKQKKYLAFLMEQSGSSQTEIARKTKDMSSRDASAEIERLKNRTSG